MARLIDADALLKVLQHRVKGNEDSGIVVGTNNTLCIVEELVRSIPTVDAVPVVKCKNCLYYQETIGKDSGKPCGYGSCCVPGRITGIVYDEEFCSYGERKSDG